MNILAICNKSPYPPHDGGSLASYNLIASLSRLGHDVTLLTMCTPKHGLTNNEKDELSNRVRLYTFEVDTTVNIFRLLKNLLFSKLPYNAERFISESFGNELARILRSASFDIVQLEGLYLIPYIDIIRRNSSARIVLRAHNIEQEIWSRIAKNETNPGRKYYFTLLSKRLANFERDAINRYDLLVPITAKDMAEFVRMGNTKPVHVCPAGLDLPDHPLSPPAFTNSLFFLGSLDWMPNQEGLLWFVDKVFPDLLSLYPLLKLHIAGRNAPEWLIKRIRRKGIVFHGEIKESGNFICENGILVTPCFSGSGMRIKIIEAMAYGKPVITTSVGAEGLGVTHRENILICQSADEFLQCLDDLLKFPDFYRTIGLNAMKFVLEKFDNMKITAELCSFYKNYLG